MNKFTAAFLFSLVVYICGCSVVVVYEYSGGIEKTNVTETETETETKTTNHEGTEVDLAPF